MVWPATASPLGTGTGAAAFDAAASSGTARVAALRPRIVPPAAAVARRKRLREDLMYVLCLRRYDRFLGQDDFAKGEAMPFESACQLASRNIGEGTTRVYGICGRHNDPECAERGQRPYFRPT